MMMLSEGQESFKKVVSVFSKSLIEQKSFKSSRLDTILAWD